MNRILSFLGIFIIWIGVTAVQVILVLIAEIDFIISSILIGIPTLLFGLIIYLQDRSLKKIEKESKEFKENLDEMFDFKKQ